VLSYSYWKTRFASSRDVVGQTVLINGHPFTILGVAPENFDSAIGGYKPGVFIPISMVEVAMPWMAPRDDLNRPSVGLADAGGAAEAGRERCPRPRPAWGRCGTRCAQ
jgi:hypothetical protein